MDDVVVHITRDPVPVVQHRHLRSLPLSPSRQERQPRQLCVVGQPRHRLDLKGVSTSATHATSRAPGHRGPAATATRPLSCPQPPRHSSEVVTQTRVRRRGGGGGEQDRLARGTQLRPGAPVQGDPNRPVGQRIRRDRPGLRPLGGRADRDNRVEQLAQPVLRPARRGDPHAQLGHQVLEVQGLRTRPGRRDQRDLAL